MQQYHAIINEALELGIFKGDRTNTGTQSRFGQQQRFALHKDFIPVLPKVTTKFTHQDSIDHELFWIIKGDTRLEYLIENNIRIWNEWVLKGTEVYRPYLVSEMVSLMAKKIGSKETKFDVVFVNEPDTPWEFKETIDGAKKSLHVDVQAYKKADEPIVRADHETEQDYQVGMFQKIYRVIFGEEPKKLIGGSLGQVYGKTWRDIDDVRIIDKREWPDFEERGFTFVIDIPGEDYTTDQCVIRRKVDQLAEVLNALSREPSPGDKGNNRDSRRMIICAWDPRLIDDQALPPCHAFIQFWTRELTLQERLDVFNAQADQREAKEREEGIVWRGTPQPTTTEQFIKYLELWRKEPVTEEDLHIKFDDLGVPRRAISCSMYQRS